MPPKRPRTRATLAVALVKRPPTDLFQRQQRFTLACRFDGLPVFDYLNQLLAAFGTPDHQHSHQLVLAEEEFAIVLVPLLARFAPRNTAQFGIIRFRRANDRDIDIEQWAGVGRHIDIGFVTTRHVSGNDAPMRHRIVPGSHRMIFAHMHIVKFGHVASREDTGNVGFKIFVDHHATAYLDRRLRQYVRIQRDTQADANHICLNFTSLSGFNVSGYPILRYNRFDFITVNNFHVKFARDIVHHLAAFWIKRATQPEGAAHHPGSVQLAHSETIAEFVRNKTAPVGQCGARLQHTRDDGFGIIERDKVIDVFRILRSRRAQGVGPATGGDQQGIVGIGFAIVSRHYLFVYIHLRDHRICYQVDIALLVPGKIAYHHLLLHQHPLQKARQRYAIIQWIGFISEHMDAAIQVVLAQCIGGSGTGNAVPNDYVASIVRGQMLKSPCPVEYHNLNLWRF